MVLCRKAREALTTKAIGEADWGERVSTYVGSALGNGPFRNEFLRKQAPIKTSTYVIYVIYGARSSVHGLFKMSPHYV